MTTWNTREYDFYRDHIETAPEFWEYLRANEPIAKSEAYGGYYLVARYDDVDRILRDTNRFVSRYGTAISAGPNLEDLESPMVPIDSDPPLTGKYRKLVSREMAKAPMEARTEEVEMLAKRLLDDVPGNRFDYVEHFADPFPREVTMRAIGFDLADLAEVRGWLRTQANCPRDQPEFFEARDEGDRYLQRVISERRLEGPRDDLVSCVAFGEVDGEQLPVKEAASLLKNLLMGALGTTTKTLTDTVHLFATQPEIADRFREDPDLWETGVEEVLRYTSVIHAFGRTVVTDTELGGCPMSRGDRVRPLIGSANRDETKFDRPDQFIADRSPNRHLTFGQGAHKCIGQHLARVMIRVALSELLHRYDTIELDPDEEVEWYAMESGTARRTLPIRVS